MDPFDDVHVAVVRHAHRLVDREICLRQQRNGVDDERPAFPSPDRVAMKTGVRISRMRPPVGVDAAQPVAVALAEQRHASRRDQQLEGIVGDQHVARHAGRKAMIDDGKWPSGFLFFVHVLDLFGNLRRPRRRVGLLLRDLIADDRSPNAAEVRQPGERLPITQGGRRIASDPWPQARRLAQTKQTLREARK